MKIRRQIEGASLMIFLDDLTAYLTCIDVLLDVKCNVVVICTERGKGHPTCDTSVENLYGLLVLTKQDDPFGAPCSTVQSQYHRDALHSVGLEPYFDRFIKTKSSSTDL